jgi:subtilisin family serine protease
MNRRNTINLLLIVLIFGAMVVAQLPWNLDRIDDRFGFDGTYEPTARGQGVRVYVVDSGIEYSHPEFEGRAIKGYGRDDQCNSHGTAVAGLIGSHSYGVANQVQLVSVKIQKCGESFLTAGAVAKGLDWVLRDARRFSGRSVVNISFSGDRWAPLDDKVRELISAGIPVVASAGNDGYDACNNSPSGVIEAITVGGTDSYDNLLSYTNTGPCVDIYAPGEGAWTTWTGGQMTYFSGTSAAAPHAAGLSAIYLERNPLATPAEVSEAIVSNSTDLGFPFIFVF